MHKMFSLKIILYSTLLGLSSAIAQAGESGGGSYVALDARGKPTAPRSGAKPHPCVLDSTTGLVWEVKTDDNGPSDKDWTFTWFATKRGDNDKDVGYANGGRCAAKTGCDSEGYVAATNKRKLCGYKDWRLPAAEELEGLLRPEATGAKIDPRYFPNTPANYFWTGTYVPLEVGGAMFVSFELAMVLVGNSASAAHLRLVRGPDKP